MSTLRRIEVIDYNFYNINDIIIYELFVLGFVVTLKPVGKSIYFGIMMYYYYEY